MKTIRLTEHQLNKLVSESVNKILTESFQSDTLRKFFKEHGGVSNDFRQFSLGDISDDQIGYYREFNSTNDASNEMHNLKKPDQYGKRSDYDMKFLFHIFKANDGTSLLIGVDRDTIQTRPFWGGEYQKKVADRMWQNGIKRTGGTKYVDDKDMYYYQSPAKDFGVYNSKDFKGKMSDNKNALERQPSENRTKFKKDKLQHMRDYLKKYYPDTLRKLNK